MKQIRKRAISTLLTLCMILAVSPALAASDTEQQELDTSNTTLSGTYKVTESRELYDLKVEGTAVIYIAKDVTLTVRGTDGSGMTPGKAAIELTEGNTLIVTGEGKLIANGGNAGDPTNGTDGKAAEWISGTSLDAVFSSGAGGSGGSGGGGAGAGIGTAGGKGGIGGLGGSAASSVLGESPSRNGWIYGTEACKGVDGEIARSDIGVLYVLGTVSVEARGGDESAEGNAGSYGISHYSANIKGYRKTFGAGGGGGGGGAGDYARAYGAGGGGGGGGGGGAGGCIRFNQLGNSMPIYYGDSGDGGGLGGRNAYGNSRWVLYYRTTYDVSPHNGSFSYERNGNFQAGGAGGKSGREYSPAMTVYCTGGTHINTGYWIDSPSVTEPATGVIKAAQYTLTLMNGSDIFAERFLTYGHTQVTDAIVFPAPSREGYAFRGYYRTADAAANLTEADLMIDSGGNAIGDNRGDSLQNGRWVGTENLTFYAAWKEANTAVTLIIGDGAEIDYSTIYANVGDCYGYMPHPTKTNLSFGGWFTKDGTDDDWGSEVTAGTVVTNGEPHRLYAKWIRGIPDVAVEIAEQTYDGLAHTPEPRVTYYGQELRQGIDYSVTYSNNINAGQASVTVIGMGIYEGKKTVNFTINPAPLTITGAQLAEKTYDGIGKGIVTGVTLAGLQNGEAMRMDDNDDSTGYEEYSACVVYDDENAGSGKTATVTVSLNWQSHMTRNYTIDNALVLSGQTIRQREVTDDDLYILPLVKYVVLPGVGDFVEPLVASGVMGSLTYSYNGGDYEDYAATRARLETLQAGTEGTLSCKFTAEGNHTGEAAAILSFAVEDATFTVNGEKASAENVVEVNPTYAATWDEIVSFKDNITLVAAAGWEEDDNQDHFTINVSGSPEVGEHEYQVLYNGIMCGMAFVDYVICSGTVNVTPKDISEATVILGDSLIYSGKAQTQSVSVASGTVTLAADTDYTVSGNSSIDAGTYTLTVIGTGNYEGTVTKEWSIAKKDLTITAKEQTIAYTVGVEQVYVSALADGDTLTDITLTAIAPSASGNGTITPSAAIIKNGETDNTANYSITYTSGILTKEYEISFIISKDCFSPALDKDIVYKTVKTTVTSYGDFPENAEVEAYLKEQYGVYPIDFSWRDKFGYTLDAYNTLDPRNSIGYAAFLCDDISFDFYDADGMWLSDDGYYPFKVQSIEGLMLPAAPQSEEYKDYISGWSLETGGEIVTKEALKEIFMQADFEGTFELYAVYKPIDFTSADIKFVNESGTEYTTALNAGDSVKAQLATGAAAGTFKPTLILVLYSGNRLVGIASSSESQTSAEGFIETPAVTANQDNLTVKAFVWNSLSDLLPLCEGADMR